ncbi:MAG: hypothetical protein ABI945_00205 [Nitrospirales bacterium]
MGLRRGSRAHFFRKRRSGVNNTGGIIFGPRSSIRRMSYPNAGSGGAGLSETVGERDGGTTICR